LHNFHYQIGGKVKFQLALQSSYQWADGGYVTMLLCRKQDAQNTDDWESHFMCNRSAEALIKRRASGQFSASCSIAWVNSAIVGFS